jgi:hypothetical protein
MSTLDWMELHGIAWIRNISREGDAWKASRESLGQRFELPDILVISSFLSSHVGKTKVFA